MERVTVQDIQRRQWGARLPSFAPAGGNTPPHKIWHRSESRGEDGVSHFKSTNATRQVPAGPVQPGSIKTQLTEVIWNIIRLRDCTNPIGIISNHLTEPEAKGVSVHL